MLPRAVRWIRALVDLVFPRGAIVLSVLSLGYFAMGIVRNRVFANTFGAGAELDAYNAAFRIPEIALDVLVASGLTAPFVPIFTSLRRDDEEAANTFGRTVLTSAVAVMIVAASIITMVAPWLADAFQGFEPSTRALYIDLLRINCLALVLFAASIALGEILVANRRFVFYALAPILYTGGIVLGAVLFSDRLGVHAAAWGAVVGAAAHLAIRALGTRWTTFRIRPAFAVRTPAFREFLRLMLPRMVSHPIEPVTLTYFTILAASLGTGSVTAFNFASDYQVLPVSLIGVSFSLAVFPTLSAAYAEGDAGTYPRGPRPEPADDRRPHRPRSRGPLRPCPGCSLTCSLAAVGSGPTMSLASGVVAAFAISIPFDALAYPLSRGLYATHDTIRQVIASFVGLAVVVAVSQLLVGPLGILAIPLGYAAGMAIKDVLLAFFLVGRLRGIGAGGQPPGAVSVGTTEM